MDLKNNRLGLPTVIMHGHAIVILLSSKINPYVCNMSKTKNQKTDALASVHGIILMVLL